MADAAKYAPINGGNLLSELRPHFFSVTKAQRTKVCVYGCVFVFIALSIFLAFSPSPNTSSAWFTNVFSLSSSSFSDESDRSHNSSASSHFSPNSTQQVHNFTAPKPDNAPSNSSQMLNLSKEDEIKKNQTLGSDKVEIKENQTLGSDKVEALKPLNQSTAVNNQTLYSGDDKVGIFNSKNVSSSIETQKSPANQTAASGEKRIAEKSGSEDLIESLLGCDFFDGNWVKDESYPLYKPGSCSLIDEQFNCFLNGRPDIDYYKYRWKPNSCTLPRMNATHMLDVLRGKRLVFVGDSLNRNMWESLVCILRNSVKDQKKVYEQSGRQYFRGEASYTFVFEDYNFTVEFFVSPFLVQEWEITDKNGQKKETLRLDLVSHSAGKYKDADVLVFNTGHWWTHEKTSKGEDYYQEGSHVYPELDVLEAFRKALTTWGRWVDANVDPAKTLVLFRGYSASHFSGGQWNSGGACDHETEPIKNETYLTPYPPKMEVLERVLRGMKTPVSYLNVTRMTDFRKDGHPSMYRKQHLSDEERKSPMMYQDCSHWCLPGVPDSWNEILYANLLVNQYQKKQQQTKS